MKAQCPFTEGHISGQDTNPSLTINLERGVYFCNACGAKGNIHTFYSHFHKLDKVAAWLELGDALGLERPVDVDSRPAIDPALPGQYNHRLHEYNGPTKDRLYTKRGLTQASLDQFMIGWDGDRITIPIYDEFNDLVNIRRYKWDSYEDNFKMINYIDELGNTYGENRIYGIENLVDSDIEEIVWCEGEWDRIVAEQNGLHACTSTSGANNFRFEWLSMLRRKKRIYICYDNDDAGRTATNVMVNSLRGSVEIYVAGWSDEYPKKCDITDLFTDLDFNKEKFMNFFVPLEQKLAEIPQIPLAVSSNAKYAGRRIKIPVLVAGKENAPFIYPKSVAVSCSSGSEDSKPCTFCNLLNTKRVDLTFTSDKASILKLVNCTDDVQLMLLRRAAGANTKCARSLVDIKEYGNMEAVNMIPKAEANFGFAAKHEYVVRMGYMLGNNLPTNKRYLLVGYLHADPATQRATYVFDEAYPEKGLLDELEVTPEINEQLKVFQCKPGQTVAEKFKEIHTDLERNVTYIWDRHKVAYAVDLVFHTTLSFVFQEQQVKRGWAECLIIGDSGQAKTTVVERLMGHYRCGELLSGESSRRTGLVYSLQQSSGKGQWSLMWGAMPLNDGGLLCVDELSGMSEDDLAKMSDVRSSGIAKTTGVITAETTARTRMIFISNPRNGRQMKTENYGAMAVLKLFGKAEDVRRLDFAVGVASGEVDADIVNKSVSDMPPVEHIYTSDLCRTRVLWAWSRHPEQVIFTPEASQKILEQASRMGKKYSSRVPLVESADQRIKLARLSVSAAACVYSTDDEGVNIIVKPEHVEFVVNYLEECYTARSMGYDKLSADDFENSNTEDATLLALRNEFLSIPIVGRSMNEVVKAMYQLTYFNRNSLEDATGLDRDELKELLHFMISKSLIEKTTSDYRRTPLGLAFIEYMLMNPPNNEEVAELRRKRFEKTEM